MSEHQKSGGARALAGALGPTFDSPGRTIGRPQAAPDEAVARFVALSAALTGYDEAELWGTGMVETYLGFTWRAAGSRVVGKLLSVWSDIEADVARAEAESQVAVAAGGEQDGSNAHENNGDHAALDRHTPLEIAIRSRIMLNPTLGPIGRNLVVLWYLGQWNQLPADWRDVHGANAMDMTGYVSAEAYTQGLVWEAIGTHPQGAKMPGYGSWALPPKQLEGGA